jgi:hypothetical protein
MPQPEELKKFLRILAGEEYDPDQENWRGDWSFNDYTSNDWTYNGARGGAAENYERR